MNYLFYLNNKYKAKSAKRKMASLHAFFEYLEFEEIIEENPMRKMKYKMKQEQKLPRVIDQNNLSAIYKALYENKNSKTFLKDSAIIELLFATGIRVSELCSLKIKDVNLEEKWIRVYGKGSKERILYLGNNEVIERLIKYKLEYRFNIIEDEYFFVNQVYEAISDQSIRNIIKRYTKKAGIQDHITPHMFRHTFATVLLEEDVDIPYIQNILGHSSISTTQIYTHISSKKQKDIMIHKNPRNRVSV